MKKMLVLFTLLTLSSGAHAADLCQTNARTAAESAYGLSPDGTKVEVMTAGARYRVTVGLRNPESGAHDFYVIFPSGCASTPEVSEVPMISVSPLQNDAHAVYNQLVGASSNIGENAAVAPSELPAPAQKIFAERVQNLQQMIPRWSQQDATATQLAVSVYKVQVDGQDTFAIWVPNLQDSIRAYMTLVDSYGREIDQAAIYHGADVGQNGVSWQNETDYQRD